jgi:methylenetetrahydrofolate reductase (NADPH)
MTGDFPLYGFEGKAKPVYDMDSVQLLRLIGQMNDGRCIDGLAPGGGLECPPTHFFRGAAVSPFKREEAEGMVQYYKLFKKVRMGADFIITQVGFDARKFDELIRFLRHHDLRIPVLGNVYLLNRPVARVMNRGGVPGCMVTDDLYRMIESESQAPDRGKSARLSRAAKLIAVLRGIGYEGVHLGGPHLGFEDVERVIEKSKEYFLNWQAWLPEFSFPQPGGFYLYEKDVETGLNKNTPAPVRRPPRKKIGFAFMRFCHNFIFRPEAPLHKPARWFCRKIDGSPMDRTFTELENWVKFISSRCRRCGDCTLSEMAFLCPQSQCPKFLFNGQCGGSKEGWCEVFPGKKRCIFVRAYNRLKPYGAEESLKENYLPPRNWALDQTSSWTNYFLGRDHHTIRT